MINIIRLCFYIVSLLLILFIIELPIGFAYIKLNISNSSSIPDDDPHINNIGQVVWQGYFNGGDIFYYDNDSGNDPLNVTNNAFLEGSPQINDNGEMIWMRNDGEGGLSVYYYDVKKGGVPIKVFSSEYLVEDCQINNNGQVVWISREKQHTEFGDYLIEGISYYDARTNEPPKIIGGLPPEMKDFESLRINDEGELVWSAWIDDYLCYYDIYYYNIKTSTLKRITNDFHRDDFPYINNYGEITWAEEYYDLKGNIYYRIYYINENVSNTPLLIQEYNKWGGYGIVELFAPKINNNGQIFWVSLHSNSGKNEYRINYYDVKQGGNSVTFFSVPEHAIYFFDINDNGQVVWNAWDGCNYEIYYYNVIEGGKPVNISNADYLSDSISPMINNRGEIVWSGGGDIWLVTMRKDVDLFEYEFTYASGDSYKGIIYASERLGYYEGYEFNFLDESGQNGNYRILKEGPQDVLYSDREGEVYVVSYFDADSCQIFTPLNSDIPQGYEYLSSESGYIQRNDMAELHFGRSPAGIIEEADAYLSQHFLATLSGGQQYYYLSFLFSDHGYNYGFSLTNPDNYLVGANYLLQSSPIEGNRWDITLSFIKFSDGDIYFGLTYASHLEGFYLGYKGSLSLGMAPYLAAHYALSVDTSQGSMYDYSCLFKNGSIYTGKALNKTVEGHFAAYPQSTPAFFYYCYYQGELPSTSYAGLHYSNYWNMIGVVTLMDYLD